MTTISTIGLMSLALSKGRSWLADLKSAVWSSASIKLPELPPRQPFEPHLRFWEIQRGISDADLEFLPALVARSLLDSHFKNLKPSRLSFAYVRSCVILIDHRYFAVDYSFRNARELTESTQRWHFNLDNNGHWLLTDITPNRARTKSTKKVVTVTDITTKGGRTKLTKKVLTPTAKKT